MSTEEKEMTMIGKWRCPLLALLLLAGCHHHSHMRVSSNNPASPLAAEAPAPNAGEGIVPGVSGQEPTGGAMPSSSTGGMGHMGHMNMPKASQTASNEGELQYTCPMHPQVVQAKPGNCPICGMKLTPKK